MAHVDKKDPTPLVPMLEQVQWERTTESRISTVIRLLPTSLQPRIGSLGGQFRRTSSLGNIRGVTATTTDTTTATEQKPQQQQQLPPSRPVSAPGRAANRASWGAMSSASSAASSDTVAADVAGLEMVPSKRQSLSGINWRLADQGTSLVGIAAEANDTDDAVLGRKAYVDGLTYLLKSLPTDLNVHEAEQIRSALPGQVSQRWEEESRLERQQHQQQLGVDDYYGSGPGSPGGYRRQHKSTVHRVVQALVLNAILLVHLVLPYLALLLRAAVSVERRYHMSETLIGHGVSAVNVAGRQCARAAEVVLATASPGSDVSSTFAWAVEEITRGVSDGLGEGLLMTRLRDGGVS